MTQTNPIKISYTDARLRVLVEEYITQRRGPFTLKDVCSCILYWAIEEGKATQFGDRIFKGEKICHADCERISVALEKIVSEGRITSNGDKFKTTMK